MADPENGPSATDCVGPGEAILDGDRETLGRVRGFTDDGFDVGWVGDTVAAETERAGLPGPDVGDGFLVWRVARAATRETSTRGCRPRVRTATGRRRRSSWCVRSDREPVPRVPVSGGARAQSRRRRTDDDSSAVRTGR